MRKTAPVSAVDATDANNASCIPNAVYQRREATRNAFLQ